jgi:hypothetical protein
MVRKKVPITKNHSPKNEDVIPRSETNLEDKIIYAIANTSVILMSTMMDAFTQVIGSTMGAIASGMAGTLGGEEASDKVDQELKQGLPGIDEKMKAGISELRKEIYSQITQKRQDLERVFSDPVFEVGPKIIEEYDFNLPKLTQKLDDDVLSQYSKLIVNEDVRFAKMFKELIEWINSLPKPN